MNDKRALSPREELERRKARLLEEAAALDRDMAEIDHLAELAAKHGLVLTPAPKSPSSFDGTMAALADLYQQDPDSPFQKIKFRTRNYYVSLIRRIVRDIGAEKISGLDGRRILRQHEAWGAGGHVAMAHSLIGMVRMLAAFGATFIGDKDCQNLKSTLSNMQFKMSKPRTEQLTAEYVDAIREHAHKMGFPSIALAQSLQFACRLAQKDTIGDWVPEEEPGESDTRFDGQKWLYGIRWDQVDDNLILRHVTSKGAKQLKLSLSEYPIVSAEIIKLGKRPTTGPIIICERTGRPWRADHFREWWRKIARAACVPDSVRNMDSRSLVRNERHLKRAEERSEGPPMIAREAITLVPRRRLIVVPK